MTVLPDRVVDQLLAHARRDAPNEACGLIYRHRSREDLQVVECRNLSSHPWQGFLIGPWRSRRGPRLGFHLWGIYHSHPAGGLLPSPGDLRAVAQTPNLAHFIVDPLDGEVAQISPANAPA